MSKEEIKETPTGDLEQGEFKIKKKPKKLANKKKEEPIKVDLSKKPKEETTKLDLSKTKEDAVQESSTEKVVFSSCICPLLAIPLLVLLSSHQTVTQLSLCLTLERHLL